MSRPDPHAGLPTRLLAIAGTIAVMTAALIVLPRYSFSRGSFRPPPATAVVTPAAEPIAAEASVFRTRAAAEFTLPRRGTAHVRTLATARALRAFPGAPPRIPHGLTRDEARANQCGTCHERGGYAQRFEAYAPRTPHAELEDCLQCHLPDARLVGVSLPRPGPDERCRQCHAPAGERTDLPRLNWTPAAWPGPAPRVPRGGPPSIPHSLETRGDCLACHMGPAAVAEIRTSHPERANCRQCHLAAPSDGDAYRRPAIPADTANGERT